MLFDKENIALRKALSKAAVAGNLYTMRGNLSKKFDNLSLTEIEHFLMQPEKYGKTRIASELTTYYLILSILDHGSDGDGYGFPFDQRYLNFYQRLKDACMTIKKVQGFYSSKTKDDRIVWKLYHVIKGVVEDPAVKKIVELYEIKLAVFSDLREAFGTTPKSVNNGLTQMKEITSHREHQKIKKAAHKFLVLPSFPWVILNTGVHLVSTIQLKNALKSAKVNQGRAQLFDIIGWLYFVIKATIT
jgi:hypothetical protein